MEKQSKLLEKNYLSARLNDFKEIKNKKVKYSLMETENNSLYVTLIGKNKTKIIRIGQISKPEYKDKEFLVNDKMILDKSVKDKYINFLHNNVKEIYR